MRCRRFPGRAELGLLIGLWACSGPAADTAAPANHDDTADPANPGTALTPFERDLAPKLAGCAGCHSGDDPSGQLDLSDPFAAVDAESNQSTLVLIAPGDHLESYLWHKVSGTHGIAGGLGTRMPVGGAWPQEDIDLLAQWINLGAPP